MTTAPLWALVTFTASGECLVDRTSLRASLDGFPTAPAFGADDDDDFDDDEFADELDGDIDGDFDGDFDGDIDGDVDGDFDGDETGDEVGMTAKERKLHRIRRREARLKKREHRLERKLHKHRKGKVMERNVTVTGTVAGAVGQAMSVTLTPRTSLHLSKIFATGDTAATINTIISGDDPVVLDNLDAALLAPTAYHGPGFEGRVLKAGVPVTINYTAGSNTTALKLSFYGKVRVRSVRC
jgi:hypothetical protein